MREIKFRAWIQEHKGYGGFAFKSKMSESFTFSDFDCDFLIREGVYLQDMKIMQYTGLKDQNGLAEIYEGDIIDEYGDIKGNIYQMDKGETDTVIQGFGTKTWCETYRRAILLGLKDAE